jgi:hypothetical protein
MEKVIFVNTAGGSFDSRSTSRSPSAGAIVSIQDYNNTFAFKFFNSRPKWFRIN